MKKWIILLVVLLVAAPAGYFGYKTLMPVKTSSATSHAAPPPAPTTPPVADTTSQEVQLDTADIHGLINQERKKVGVRQLDVNDDLYDAALAKCQDMQKNNYFTHVSPKGADYNTFIKKAVPTAKLTGENLGAGYTDDAALIKDWMGSDEHKANILNPKFTEEAIAVCGKSTIKPGLIIVDHFIQL
jgi:uncharacterized protein YkwD